VGLYADSRRAEEHRAQGGPVHDRASIESPRPAARAGAPDLVANAPAHALRGRCRSRLLHDRGWRGQVTFCTMFVIELASRRVRLARPPPL
jgi:hypothetical protein